MEYAKCSPGKSQKMVLFFLEHYNHSRHHKILTEVKLREIKQMEMARVLGMRKNDCYPTMMMLREVYWKLENKQKKKVYPLHCDI